MNIQISASILSSDFGNINSEIRSIEKYVDWIHVDVMDGHFVPNITLGAPVVAALKSVRPIECHLMIEHPEEYVSDFVTAGAKRIIIHQEVCPHLHRNIQQIKDLGIQVGVALNPATSLMTIEDVLFDLDLVLFMTVNPGFGGQKFISSVIPKIQELRALCPNLDIEVDGGIHDKSASKVIEAGANVLVSGSYIFQSKNRASAIKLLRNS